MRSILIYSFIIAAFVVIGFAGYGFLQSFSYTRHIELPAHLLASSSTPEEIVAVEPSSFGQPDRLMLDPASSTADRTGWKTYKDDEWGFAISYPADFAVKPGITGIFSIVVPKERYFQWPLQDDATVTVTASSSCQGLRSEMVDDSPHTFLDQGRSFIQTQSVDVAAGNIYRELAYDTTGHGLCYHISLFSHGANGAGLYVSDKSFIDRYDKQHQVELDRLVSIFTGIVGSFKIVETPVGEPEDGLSPG